MKNPVSHLTVFLASVGISLVCGANAEAQSAFTPPVFTEITPSLEPTGNDGMFFTPTTAISVTALGYVSAVAANGNLVGLYDVSTSDLLASTTVTAASTPSGGFLYQAISPVLLTPGTEYAVVGLYTAGTGDLGYFAPNGVGADPAINFVGYSYDDNPSLDLPASGYTPPIFGPNFQFAAVPEPSSGALIAAGLAALGFFRRKAE
jgi:hypothetical protein